MAGLNACVGWGISTLALYFLNKNAGSKSETNYEPESLNVNANQTKIGSPIPVVLGRCLVKSPLVPYYGDFEARRYTETYAAHAKFNAWPLVFALIAQYIAAAISGHQVTPGTVSAQGTGYHGTPVHSSGASTGATFKDDLVGPLINSLFMWLLSWLINGRNLKTTLQKGFKYYLGYQQLVCWSGEQMRLRAIYLKEKKVWEGDVARAAQQGAPFVVKIDEEELFGGPDEQGGFVGQLRVYLGGESQEPDPWLVEQMRADTVQQELRGLTSAYRAFVTVVVPKSYIGKQATVPETWLELSNCPNRLGLGAVGEDANPAEVLYELHVNEAWGLAEDAALLEVASLQSMGRTLKEEGVGVSVQLTQKTDARSLVDTILEHVNAVKYADPRTGKLTFKLIRDDYDANEVKRLTTNNCALVEFSRPGWIDIVPSISVAYTDRAANYEQSTIPAIDAAGLEISGAKTTKTYSYTYFTTAENALWAAKREQYQQGYPLAAVHAQGNRQLADLRVGDVVRLDWEPYGIEKLLLRVTDVDAGDLVDGIVKIEAVEDVFALAKAEFGFSGSTEWRPPDIYPTGVQLFRYLEMPWELSQAKDTYVCAFAVRPDELTELWTVWRRRPGGDLEPTTSQTNWTAAGRLVYDYAEFTDAEDAMGFEVVDLGGMEKLDAGDETDAASARRGGKLLLVGDELMAYGSLQLLANGHWYVKGVLRGVYDTVPKRHFSQSTVYFVRSGYWANVTTGGAVCKAGEMADEVYDITTATADHEEKLDYTKAVQLKTARRAERPSPPGRVRLSAHNRTEEIHPKSLAGDLTVSWTARDKWSSYGCVCQDDAVEYWSRLPFQAPNGSNCLIRLCVGTDEKEYETADETVEAFVYSWAQRCLDFPNDFQNPVELKLYAKLDGLLSHQAQVRQFKWEIPTGVDCVLTEADGQAVLSAWCLDEYLLVPAGSAGADVIVRYEDLPLVLLGRPAQAGDAEVYVGQSGALFVPDGRALFVTGKGTYTLAALDVGYILASRHTQGNTGGVLYYQWDGTKLVLLPGLNV